MRFLWPPTKPTVLAIAVLLCTGAIAYGPLHSGPIMVVGGLAFQSRNVWGRYYLDISIATGTEGQPAPSKVILPLRGSVYIVQGSQEWTLDGHPGVPASFKWTHLGWSDVVIVDEGKHTMLPYVPQSGGDISVGSNPMLSPDIKRFSRENNVPIWVGSAIVPY